MGVERRGWRKSNSLASLRIGVAVTNCPTLNEEKVAGKIVSKETDVEMC